MVKCDNLRTKNAKNKILSWFKIKKNHGFSKLTLSPFSCTVKILPHPMRLHNLVGGSTGPG